MPQSCHSRRSRVRRANFHISIIGPGAVWSLQELQGLDKPQRLRHAPSKILIGTQRQERSVSGAESAAGDNEITSVLSAMLFDSPDGPGCKVGWRSTFALHRAQCGPTSGQTAEVDEVQLLTGPEAL